MNVTMDVKFVKLDFMLAKHLFNVHLSLDLKFFAQAKLHRNLYYDEPQMN